MNKEVYMIYWALLYAGWKVIRRKGELCICTHLNVYSLSGFGPFYNAHYLHRFLQTPNVEVLGG